MLNLRGVRSNGLKSLVAAGILALGVVAASGATTVAPAAAQTHTLPDLVVDLNRYFDGDDLWEVRHGESFEYLLNVRNQAAGTSETVHFLQILPNAFTDVRVVSASSGVTCQVSPFFNSRNAVKCQKGTLGTGQLVGVRITARAPTTPGQHPAWAWVDSGGRIEEINENNNRDDVTIRVY